jgi:hypothetical protein
MHQVAALTFGQEIWKAVIGAAATAFFVALFGAIGGTYWVNRRDRRRERFDLRAQLLDRVSKTAYAMFIGCQQVSRVLRGRPDTETRMSVLQALDQQYQEFWIDASAISNELGARYGFTDNPQAPAFKSGESVWSRWHQVHDALTVYYFNLKGPFPGDTLARNAIGFEGGHHSGIQLTDFRDDLSAMRKEVRRSYREAMRDLAERIMSAPINTG